MLTSNTKPEFSGIMSCLYSICHSKGHTQNMNITEWKINAQRIKNKKHIKHESHPIPTARESVPSSVFCLEFSPTPDEACPSPNSVCNQAEHPEVSTTLVVLPLQPSLAWNAIRAVLSGESSFLCTLRMQKTHTLLSFSQHSSGPFVITTWNHRKVPLE